MSIEGDAISEKKINSSGPTCIAESSALEAMRGSMDSIPMMPPHR
jgi:hypothetical protein